MQVFIKKYLMATQSNVPTSRLLTSTTSLRETLITRNLYTPDVNYPLLNENNVSKVVGAISSIVGGLTPFKSINLENSVLGRVITEQTPLSQISLMLLGKQLAFNSMSHIAQENMPIINVGAALTGGKLFTKKIDYDITIKPKGNFINNLLSSVVGTYSSPSSVDIFSKNTTNSEYIQKTGEGQLKLLFENINNNIYKPSKTNDNITLYDYADKVNESIKPRSSLISINNTKYFTFDNNQINPYYSLSLTYNSITAIEEANKNMINSMNKSSEDYAPNITVVNENFGKTNNYKSSNLSLNTSSDTFANNWIGSNSNSEFSDDVLSNKVVWGRDGIIPEVTNYVSDLQGLTAEEKSGLTPHDLSSGFNIKTGLLEYTRNLVNATEGRIGDITRKAFTNGTELIGFNGSALWKAPSTALPASAGKTGLRQHSVLDQYDRFAKAIRFDGNKSYGGNPNSVIYNSVLPRIHPVLNNLGKPDPKNLMLSIENLAVNIISKDEYGIMDDEYGSPIPLSEVGPFNGRIMWFPPYSLEIQETATAKYESTVMVGRNEPMYNYQNSERTATLNFTLLVDHPQQLKNYIGEKNSQKKVSEFFAFGENITNTSTYLVNSDLKIDVLQAQINSIVNLPSTAPLLPIPSPVSMYFPNNSPAADKIDTIVNSMYNNTYDIGYNVRNLADNSYGDLNRHVYYVNSLYKLTEKTLEFNLNFAQSENISQYTATGVTDQFGVPSDFNVMLHDLFDNADNRKYYSIDIIGSTSKLFTENGVNGTEPDYNYKLGLRRANAAKYFLERRYYTLYKRTPQNDGITINVSSIGSTNASRAGANINNINDPLVKQERNATIVIKRNGLVIEPVKRKLTPDEQTTVNELHTQIASITTMKTNMTHPNNVTDNVFNERKTSDSAILHGFQSIASNYYIPVFHSQTPEDLHKRLTFLHQCTRQGAAKHYGATPDSTGVLRARNSVFGRQPICILRVGDFFYTKVIIESINFDYTETPWDTNPEGFGMQPMLAKITLQMKIIGGQSLKGPIDALQNAVSYNYYANSTFTKDGRYLLPSAMAELQDSYKSGIDIINNKYIIADNAIVSEFNASNAERLKLLNK